MGISIPTVEVVTLDSEDFACLKVTQLVSLVRIQVLGLLKNVLPFYHSHFHFHESLITQAMWGAEREVSGKERAGINILEWRSTIANGTLGELRHVGMVVTGLDIYQEKL